MKVTKLFLSELWILLLLFVAFPQKLKCQIVEISLKIEQRDNIQLFYSPIDGYKSGLFREVRSLQKEVSPSIDFQNISFEIPGSETPFTFRIDFGRRENSYEIGYIKLMMVEKEIVWKGMEIWQSFTWNNFMFGRVVTDTEYRFKTRKVNGRIDPHIYVLDKGLERLKYFFDGTDLIESKICLKARIESQENLFLYPIENGNLLIDQMKKNQLIKSSDFSNSCFYIYTNRKLTGFRIHLGKKANNQLLIRSIEFSDNRTKLSWNSTEVERDFQITSALKSTLKDTLVLNYSQLNGTVSPILIIDDGLIGPFERAKKKIILICLFLISTVLLFVVNKKIVNSRVL